MKNALDIVNGYLDKSADLEQRISGDVSKLFDNIKIEDFIQKPESTINILIEAINKRFREKYLSLLIDISKEFAADVSNQR